jgi:hypothetical protein
MTLLSYRRTVKTLTWVVLLITVSSASGLEAAPVKVRRLQGNTRAFLVFRQAGDPRAHRRRGVPAFVRFQGAMYLHGPVWRLDSLRSNGRSERRPLPLGHPDVIDQLAGMSTTRPPAHVSTIGQARSLTRFAPRAG